MLTIHCYKPLTDGHRAVKRVESSDLNSLVITAWAALCRFGEGSFALMPGCETPFKYGHGRFSAFFDWIIDCQEAKNETVCLRDLAEGTGAKPSLKRRKVA